MNKQSIYEYIILFNKYLLFIQLYHNIPNILQSLKIDWSRVPHYSCIIAEKYIYIIQTIFIYDHLGVICI